MWQPTTKDEKLEPVFLDVNADGIFEYEMTIPENVIRASVDVSNVWEPLIMWNFLKNSSMNVFDSMI